MVPAMVPTVVVPLETAGFSTGGEGSSGDESGDSAENELLHDILLGFVSFGVWRSSPALKPFSHICRRAAVSGGTIRQSSLLIGMEL
jgi:hypothetical protein